MNRAERLQNWIETLSIPQRSTILLEMIDYAIDSEYVRFWEDSESPYFDATGNRLEDL